MNTFDGTFFNELAALDDYIFASIPPSDNFRLHVSELREAGKVSGDFVRLTHDFVAALASRSQGRYLFEKDFRVRPWQVYSHNQGRSGRKQLHIRFDATPPNRFISGDWGVSIGLGFDFRDKYGIVTQCVNEYEGFYEKVFCDQELFDATFGSLGGYAEPTGEFKMPVTAERTWQYTPSILQHWLFFGRRLTPDAISAMGSLNGFVDECIRMFEVICRAGY